jgi:hypothetical protein
LKRVIALTLNGLLLPIKLNKVKGITGNIVDIKSSDQFQDYRSYNFLMHTLAQNML